jgi:hypothetical protein
LIGHTKEELLEVAKFGSRDDSGYCRECWQLIGTPNLPWNDHEPGCPALELVALVEAIQDEPHAGT